MKVKDLPENTELKSIKLELPDDVLEQYINYAGGEKHMYIVGSMMGDFFLSPTPPDENAKRRLYPMPLSIIPANILEWEVVNG